MPASTDSVTDDGGGADRSPDAGSGDDDRPHAWAWRRHSPVRGRRLTAAESLGELVLATRVGAWLVIHLVSPMDRRLLAGSAGRRSVGGPDSRTGLLGTTGARTRQCRLTPLQYMVDDERILLVGSNGGSPRTPAWVHNLRAHPRCSLSRDGEVRRYRAVESGGDERDRTWATVCDWYSGYHRYQRRAWPRLLPVFVLEPDEDELDAERSRVQDAGADRARERPHGRARA